MRRTALGYLLALAVIAWNVVPLKAAGSAYGARSVTANGTTQHWGYDQAGQAFSATVVLSGTALFGQTDSLDAAGERTAEDDSWGHSTFGYDLACRLISASYPNGGSEQDQYDGAGNRTVITSTAVLTPHGLLAIASLKAGDTILAEDPAKGKPERVLALVDDGIKPLLALDLSGGTTLKVTSNHPFYIDNGPDISAPAWARAGDIRVGDRLRTEDGRDVTVLTVHWNVGEAHVYTLTVANDHDFFVGPDGVLVHNSSAEFCDLASATAGFSQDQKITLSTDELLDAFDWKVKGRTYLWWSSERPGDSVYFYSQFQKVATDSTNRIFFNRSLDNTGHQIDALNTAADYAAGTDRRFTSHELSFISKHEEIWPRVTF